MKTKLLALGLTLAAALPAHAAPPPVLNIHFVLHEDVEMDEAEFHNLHVAEWLGHMRGEVVPGQAIEIHIHRKLKGLESMQYGYEGVLADWQRRAAPIVAQLGGPDDRATRMVLVVQGRPGPTQSTGMAFEGTPYAIVNARFPGVVDHELGHTFGAVHDHAENRWPCSTNMSALSPDYAPCHVYTANNKALIREFLEYPAR